MPANFGQIAVHLTKEAARYQRLAKEAHDCGDHSTAAYFADLAAHHSEAALQQFEAMRPRQHQPIANKRLINKTHEQRPIGLMAILHSAAHVASAIRSALPGHNDSFTGLSLH
jgi:rubrerythrin